MTTAGTPPFGPHGSVAEEIAALADALRARTRGRDDFGEDRAPGGHEDPRHDHPPGIDTCEICPVCRAIAVLHTVSPAAVMALADLAHQAEVTLRVLATDLQTTRESGSAPTREDIPVDDLSDGDTDGHTDGGTDGVSDE